MLSSNASSQPTPAGFTTAHASPFWCWISSQWQGLLAGLSACGASSGTDLVLQLTCPGTMLLQNILACGASERRARTKACTMDTNSTPDILWAPVLAISMLAPGTPSQNYPSPERPGH